MSEPKISIITPVFNSREVLEKAVRSVAGQTYKNKEHIIVDGESDDGTVPLVLKLQKKFKHIVFLSEKDTGVYNAMNKALNMVSGDWIYFLGADDLFHNKGVLTDLAEQGLFGEEQVVYGNVIIEGDTFWAKDDSVYDGPFDLEKLFKRNLCHQSVFYPRSVIERVGFYNEKYPITADWDYNIRCYAKYPFRFVDRIIANFRTGGKSSVGGDHSFYEDLPSNVVLYFGLDPEQDQYHNPNSPFYYPMTRYREQKNQQDINALRQEITGTYNKLASLRADHQAAIGELNAAHEQSVATIRARHTAKEASMLKEFTSSLTSIVTGDADIISRLEQEHAVQLETQRKSFHDKTGRLESDLETLRNLLKQKESEFKDQQYQKEMEFSDLINRKEKEHKDHQYLKEMEFAELLNQKEKEFKDNQHHREMKFTELLNRKEKEFIDQMVRKETEANERLQRKEKEFFNLVHQKELAFQDILNRKQKEFSDQAATFKERAEQLVNIINAREKQIENMKIWHEDESSRMKETIAKRDEVIEILYHSYRYRVGNFLVAPWSYIYKKLKKKKTDKTNPDPQ